MKFLTPSGGQTNNYGVITTPAHRNIPVGIQQGLPWCADNEVFTVGYQATRFLPWLNQMKPYQSNCLFVVVPDVVGDAQSTLDAYPERAWMIRQSGWPVAYAAQDGSENLPMPRYYDALFVGGSTEWKESQGAVSVIRRAQDEGKHIHIGRVNWGRRYRMFRVLKGAELFTCDGTRQRFEGLEKTSRAWANYEAQPPLLEI